MIPPQAQYCPFGFIDLTTQIAEETLWPINFSLLLTIQE
jgi:hypothetical protein